MPDPNQSISRDAISRRTVLRGLGAALALPFLESLRPAAALAAEAGSVSAPPLRLAFLFTPNGVHVPDWTPKTFGANYELPWILEPLRNVKDDLTILTGLCHDKGRANGDGPGDHARSASVFLTGAQPYKTPGATIRSGISADQIAAQAIGSRTRFASLELGCDRGSNKGDCDSGYSCAYSNNISWAGASTPLSPEADPRGVFNRLFAGENEGESRENLARRRRQKKSILDFVLEDARSLKGRLGGSDERKIDEYFTSIREVERRIERLGSGASISEIAEPDQLPSEGRGARLGFDEHIRLMNDLLVLAFQGDATRIATFMYAREGSNRNYRLIGVPEGHHDLSHHQGNPEKYNKIRQIDRFHVTQFARFLEKLKSIPEGDGTLLDHCMIVYGSGLSDGNRHNHDNLPVILAGKGGGTIDSGRHVRFPDETPLCNLWLSLLDRMGVHAEALGDSTGRADDLVL